MKMSTRQCISVVSIIVSAMALNAFFTSASVASEIKKTNGSIILPAQDPDGSDLRTVNGRIEVGEGLSVGNVKTVNGRISIGPNATAKNVKTTNGRIYIEEGTSTDSLRTTNGRIYVEASTVNGNVRTTNGNIELEDGTKVDGSVITSNGGIKLRDSFVAKDIETRNGKVRVDNSEIRGDLIIEEKRGWSLFGFGKWDKPEVIIGPKSVIEGDIIARQDIRLHIHESASVGGIEGAEAEYFSGNRP